MKKIYITLGILAAVFLIFGFWWKSGLSPVSVTDQKPQIFKVSSGQGIREISKNLKEQGLIKDQIVFFLLTKQLGLDKKIEAGDFRLFKTMSATDIANSLTHGTLDIWITIPEGVRAQEIADIAEKEIPNYEEDWRQELEKHEGYLFPDTYLIPRDADITSIISLLTNTFDQRYATLGTPKNGLTREEVVIVASLIEREAKHSEDRPLVASVIINRLNLGMKLDIDATLQYALGYQEDEKRWWKKGLTNQDKTIDSPYNTYANPGLPPAPISNPGLASLQAVINPANTSYLFYIADRSGINRYATTLEGHEENIRKYGL